MSSFRLLAALIPCGCKTEIPFSLLAVDCGLGVGHLACSLLQSRQWQVSPLHVPPSGSPSLHRLPLCPISLTESSAFQGLLITYLGLAWIIKATLPILKSADYWSSLHLQSSYTAIPRLVFAWTTRRQAGHPRRASLEWRLPHSFILWSGKNNDPRIPIYLDFSEYDNELALVLHELFWWNLQITLNKYYYKHLYNQQNYGLEVKWEHKSWK